MITTVFLIAAALSARLTPLQAPATGPAEMMTYQMVLLKAAANAPPVSPDAQKKMSEEHLANLAELNKKRVNLVYGPVVDEGNLRGIAILDVPSAEDAKKHFAADPFVKAGVMVVEVRPWMGPLGWFQLPASYDVTKPTTLEPLVLGFLVRPPDLPALDPAKAQELQNGHLAYMTSLNAQDKLPMAGPFGDGGSSRGLVVYRVKDVAEAKALAAEDPLVKAGRLVLDAHPWMTLKGILK